MKKKKKINIVFSTNPNFDYSYEDNGCEVEDVPYNKQCLYVSIDRKGRAGKEVTLIEGFIGSNNQLKDLSKLLKRSFGVGGGFKNGDIFLQGNFKEKVFDFLIKQGFNVKKKGGR